VYALSSSQTFSVEPTNIIADLEHKLYLKEKPLNENRKVLWVGDNLPDLLPLFATLSKDSKSLVFDSSLNVINRHIPLFIRYSDSFIIDLYIDDSSKEQTLILINFLKTKNPDILNNISPRVNLGSGNILQFTSNNAIEAINLFIKLIIETSDDICNFVTSIHMEGPFENIKNIELIINSNLNLGIADIVWITLSHDFVSDFKMNIVDKDHLTNNSVIILLMILNGNFFPQYENETKAVDFLRESIQCFENNMRNYSNGVIFPPLILSRTWYLEEIDDINYNDDCFSLLWKTTDIACLNASINNRLNLLVDFVLKKPNNLIGLLQQKANLEKLKSFPNININYPNNDDFINLCQKGIEKYSVEYTRTLESKDDLLQKVEISSTESSFEKVFNVFIVYANVFIEELAENDFYKEDHDEFIELLNILKLDAFKCDSDHYNIFVNKVDNLLNKIRNRIENIDNILHNEIHNLKTRQDSLSIPTLKYTPEEKDNLIFFWNDFINIIHKHIKSIMPYDDFRKFCDLKKMEFLKKLSSTPIVYDELIKKINKYWRIYAQKIIEYFEDSTLIWKLKIDSEFAKIEEFREQNFPQEIKIPVSINIDMSLKPVIKQVLKFQITKPSIINMLMSQKAKDKWYASTMNDISKYVDDIVKQYLKDLFNWISVVEKIIDNRFGEIKKMGEDSLRNINADQDLYNKLIKETSLLKNNIETLEINLIKHNDVVKSLNISMNKWVEIKNIKY
jgi:hypothetical protein